VDDEPEVIEVGPHAVAKQRAVELIEAGATLIDVRRGYEFEAGHLEGATNIEMNALTARAGEISREQPVVFYCRTGNRSSMAVDAFREAGYEAYNLAGGIEAWNAEGGQLEPDDGAVVAPLPPS
jgi:rhodanese-related sulfurtransferase